MCVCVCVCVYLCVYVFVNGKKDTGLWSPPNSFPWQIDKVLARKDGWYGVDDLSRYKLLV